MAQQLTNEQHFVIITTRAGQRRACTLEVFQWMAREFSYLIANAEHVRKLPEGMNSPEPIREAQRRGILP